MEIKKQMNGNTDSLLFSPEHLSRTSLAKLFLTDFRAWMKKLGPLNIISTVSGSLKFDFALYLINKLIFIQILSECS